MLIHCKCFLLVPNNPSESYYGEKNSENYGYVNQKGLSRKVCSQPSVEVPKIFTMTRKNIFESVKKSLERLQLDYVDVLQCVSRTPVYSTSINYHSGHRFDPETPIEETVSLSLDGNRNGTLN